MGVNLSADTVVGLLTLLGLVYLARMQLELRRSETSANDADAMESSVVAVSQITAALMNAVETLTTREALVAELRARIEILEQHDRLKTARIEELERKLAQMECERGLLMQERDALIARLGSIQQTAVEPGESDEKMADMKYLSPDVR